MIGSPFDLSFDELPPVIPIFPLTGVLLLPRGRMPLNIFEPRYLAMVSDAMAHPRLIGMVQPREGQCDAGDPERPPVLLARTFRAPEETGGEHLAGDVGDRERVVSAGARNACVLLL